MLRSCSLITNTHTLTIGGTAQTPTCLGMRGFLQSTSSVFLPWYAQTHTHKHTPAHTGALAKPPLARSEQWEQLSHDRRLEPAFVGARERGVLLRPLARGPTRDVFVHVCVVCLQHVNGAAIKSHSCSCRLPHLNLCVLLSHAQINTYSSTTANEWDVCVHSLTVSWMCKQSRRI